MTARAAPLRSAIERTRKLVSGPIASSSLTGVALRLSGLALMFVQAVIAARLLGAENYGIVTLLLAILQIAAGLALFGFGSLAVAEIPRRLADGHAHVARLFAGHAAGRIAMASALLAVPVCAVAHVLLGSLPPGWAVPLVIGVPVLAGIQLFRGIGVGVGKPVVAQAPGEVIRPALLIAALLAGWFMADIDARIFMALYLGTAIAALAIAIVWIRLPAKGLDKGAVATSWDRAAIPFLGIHLTAILQLELATIMLGIFATPEAVGLFQPVLRISMLLMIPFYALSLGFNPRIAALHAEGRKAEITELARKYTLAATGVLVVAGIAIGLASPWLLLIFGEEFTIGAPLVWFIVAGRIAQAAFGPGAELLAMTGNAGRSFRHLALALAAEALIASILIPLYGLRGAAAAIFVGLVMRGVLLARASRSTLGIGLVEFWRGPDRGASRSL